MSVTQHPRRITVSLSSAEWAELVKAMADGKPFEVSGGDLVIEIERNRLYWIKKKEVRSEG